MQHYLTLSTKCQWLYFFSGTMFNYLTALATDTTSFPYLSGFGCILFACVSYLSMDYTCYTRSVLLTSTQESVECLNIGVPDILCWR